MISSALLLFPLLLQTSVTPAVPPPEVLTNEHVVRMVNAGLSADIIETKIKASACNFHTDTDALVALAAAKVPDPVIRAMMACTPAVNPVGAAPVAATAVAAAPAVKATPKVTVAPAGGTPPPVKPTLPPLETRLTLPATFTGIYYKLSPGKTCQGALTLTEKGFEYTTPDECTDPIKVSWSEARRWCYPPKGLFDRMRRITFFGRDRDQWLFWTEEDRTRDLSAIAEALRKTSIPAREACY
jgi:hypothetical protein